MLLGDSPWVGEIDGDKALIMTDPKSAAKRIGFLFVKGRLRRMLYGNKEIEVQGNAAEVDANPMGTKWPDVNSDDVAAANARYGIHWQDRFKLWYKNPNAAGILLAELALLSLALLMFRPVVLKLIGVAGALICSFGVACTESRSAMLGLMFGFGCLFAVHARQLFNRRNVIIASVLCAVFVAAVWMGGFADRFTVKLLAEGQSSISRLPIWAEVPKMIVAAPFGWGIGQSGLAYMNWFQPLDRGHAVLGLISTHLTWLAELGWPMRITYMFAWFTGLSLLAFSGFRRKNAFPVAVWGAFFVASCFNTIGTEITLWIIPVALLSVLVAERCWRYRKSFLAALAVGGVMTAGLTAALAILGSRADLTIHCEGRGVIVNGNYASIWIVDDGYVLSGGYYGLLGKSVREWFFRHHAAPAVGVVQRLEDVPSTATRIVAVGKTGSLLLERRADFLKEHGNITKVIFLSPPFGCEKCAEFAGGNVDVELVTGEFADRVYGGGKDERPEWVNVVPGCALYVPNWLRYVL